MMMRFNMTWLMLLFIHWKVNAWTSHHVDFVTSSTRRNFFSKVVSTTTLIVSTSGLIEVVSPDQALAASPEMFKTPNGIKYATLKKPTGKGSPIDKDIVAIEYTGYLTDGTIFGK